MVSDKNNMIEIYPAYYEDFHCIADRCEDTCCAGWEIDIDDTSYEAYMRVGGDLGARLRACVKTYEAKDGEYADYEEVYEQHGFALTEDMRCPFLDEHNLCVLYRELGEGALCEVCTNTPRNFLEYRVEGEAALLREISISASCPEAARLIYGSPEKMTFCSRCVPMSVGEAADENEEWESDEDEPMLGRFLKSVRDEAIGILQDRDRELPGRIRRFLWHAGQVQEAINRWEAGESELPSEEGSSAVEAVVGSDAESGIDGEAASDGVDLSASVGDSGAEEGASERYRRFLIRMGTYSGLASIGAAWAERMELLFESFVGADADDADAGEQRAEDAVGGRGTNDADGGARGQTAVDRDNEFLSVYTKSSDNLMKYLTKEGRLYEYEHLLVYYAFLLLNRSIDDYDYLGKAKLVVLSFLMNRDMDAAIFLKKGTFSPEDRQANARIYAREVEHAEENLADLAEEILFERAYDVEGLISCV